jgi:hypothetical protein
MISPTIRDDSLTTATQRPAAGAAREREEPPFGHATGVFMIPVRSPLEVAVA